MARYTKSRDWGFPRWRGYTDTNHAAQKVRMCDREGCTLPGNFPAPKSPNSPERWYFCEEHVTEYNRGWDYFAGLSKEEAAKRQAEEKSQSTGYAYSSYSWEGSASGRSNEVIQALKVLELEVDADFEAIKIQWRLLAKKWHPDLNGGNEEAAKRFQAIQAAFDLLRNREERGSL
ncbi:MAG: J domain-containing protein [Zymomonas mobilis subsp. pomaceae]|uniref:Heat shock protein DnaJ domain protein n=1 Tax=Zymomonas mobilis subsp. pomaceae (strain ATCC 29192 / DSM 22645 / JCM 10191 / CCUG 17912 / NBRC 13757 / NCIMB 11200 / NRRL B-4491 / Barker I) TaxID=579138 RepID=F8EU40_ZYMMT|nr:J domain-containing protein [Zymomonas mobilis]AEI37120.1 heat shock protein DnaJ domain protein [Zymomonas mobilis subsp. pomaceae ATCC 29192]MDX5948491.1 J domain-containing protein [Zymomonas mobilis subsp. pomaceae]GEB89444.1 hypothetical protein ZMO02_10810 [Zymomonas mobilis subsp. pomaceae]